MFALSWPPTSGNVYVKWLKPWKMLNWSNGMVNVKYCKNGEQRMETNEKNLIELNGTVQQWPRTINDEA